MSYRSGSGSSARLLDEAERPSGRQGTAENSLMPRSAKAGARERNGGVDALRAAVTLLVLFHHTAVTYGAVGGWYYKEVAPSQSISSLLLSVFCAANQAWFMGLFFLLAGYYTPPACARHGAAAFAKERLIRLGIPLAVYSLVLSPITVALAQTSNGLPFVGVFKYVWSHGRFEPGPLWFVQALLIFTAVWLAWHVIRNPAPAENLPFPSNMALLAAAIATGLVAFLLRLVWPVGVNVAFLQLGYFASYVVLFAAGCAGAEGKWLERVPKRQTKLWVRTAWRVFPVLPLAALLGAKLPWLSGTFEGGWNLPSLIYALWEPFVAWGFILGLLSFFQRRFAHLAGVWPSLARRAFLIYVIHPPVVVGVALAWREVAAPALIKFIVTGSLACVICYLLAGLLLRVPAVARIV
jgi:surface polysaccharide O-acyltransferase-like enzyme